MQRVIDIALKDLTQLLRDRKTFLFTLFMPAIFTLLFGYAFGGFGAAGDPRLPVGWLDQDGSALSGELHDLLAQSEAVRLVEDAAQTPAGLEGLVSEGDLAGALVVPPEFGHHLKEGRPVKLELIGDPGTPAGTSVESAALAAMIHLESAVRMAATLEDHAGQAFDYSYAQTLAAWADPPVKVVETVSAAIPPAAGGSEALAHTSPGMMLQFAIAGLLVSAQIMVNERKTHCLQRLLTTAARRENILLGHFLAVFTLTCLQFTLLILYGQYILGVNYLLAPAATGLVALAAAASVAGLGLLIGVLARNEDQAVTFSLIPMFVLVGLGGGWVPLEVAGPAFQTIGHLSPVAWGMDGFKNVVIRGLGVEAALLPAGVLLAYALGFFLLAAWRFRRMEER